MRDFRKKMRFKDRRDAGEQLALKLDAYKEQKDVVVLGLARGGMVVACAVATKLHCPLNVAVVRKVGAPGNSELAVGAIAEHEVGVFNEHLLEMLHVSADFLKEEVARQRKVLQERLLLYRGKAPPPNLRGKVVLLVDDGIATGSSMRAAIHSVRAAGARKIVVAVPVAAPESLHNIAKEVDEVVCLFTPPNFEAVGAFYHIFDQTSDAEVIQVLTRVCHS